MRRVETGKVLDVPVRGVEGTGWDGAERSSELGEQTPL